jgi:hypothetical protein
MKLTSSKGRQIVPSSGSHTDPAGVRPYEDQLSQRREWALSEGSQFFEAKGAVQKALRKIATRLNELQIPYAVAGGMALFQHGYRRFTEDVDLLIPAASLRKIHEELDGLGYVPPFPGSKSLRDAESGVRIEFLIEGQYPGDGKPKPVSFPDPRAVAEEHAGIKYLQLPRLVELKLASGMTNPQRLRDISDVMELIKLLGLPLDFELQLDEYVRPKYRELWNSCHRGVVRYMMHWKNDVLPGNVNSLDELITASNDSAAAILKEMRADGVILDPAAPTPAAYARLITTDPIVARKYGMHDESEFLE